MSRTIGIDLGTTNSCVAVLDDKGVPRVLTIDGERSDLDNLHLATGNRTSVVAA